MTRPSAYPQQAPLYRHATTRSSDDRTHFSHTLKISFNSFGALRHRSVKQPRFAVMAQLSESQLATIKDHPIEDALDSFRSAFESAHPRTNTRGGLDHFQQLVIQPGEQQPCN